MPKKAIKVGVVPIISTNTNVSRSGWKIDYASLKIMDDIEKQEAFGIDMTMDIHLPIRFRYISAKYRYGTHRVKMDSAGNLYHSITLDQNESLESANETIWHELTHCYQSEIWALGMNERGEIDATPYHWHNEEYKRYGSSGAAYYRNPYEVQAREVAATNKGYKFLKEEERQEKSLRGAIPIIRIGR